MSDGQVVAETDAGTEIRQLDSRPSNDAVEDAPDWSVAWMYVTPDEAARRDQLVRSRRVWSASPPASDAVYRNLTRLLLSLSAGEHQILRPSDSNSRWEDHWILGTRVRALLGQPGLEESRKLELGRALYKALRLPSTPGVRAESLEMWVDIGSYRRSISEARWFGSALSGFTEDQARGFAVRMAGYVTGQARLRALWEFWLADAGLPQEFIAPVKETIRVLVQRKRVFLRERLTEKQFGHLYGELDYDSEPFWRKRLRAIRDSE